MVQALLTSKLTVPLGVKLPTIVMIPGPFPGENVPLPETLPVTVPEPFNSPGVVTETLLVTEPWITSVPLLTAVAPV